MTRANNHASTKRTFEASAFAVPAANLRSSQRRSGELSEQPAERDDEIHIAHRRNRTPDLTPALILRLIEILKDL